MRPAPCPIHRLRCCRRRPGQLAEEARLKSERQPRPLSRRPDLGCPDRAAHSRGLLAVPQVRAKVVEFLQIGAMRIFRSNRRRLQPHSPATTRRSLHQPAGLIIRTCRETTLTEANSKTDFPIRPATYHPDLGQPEAFFCRSLAGRWSCWFGWMTLNRTGSGSACISWGRARLPRRATRGG